MSLIQQSHDSLPYIEADINPQTRSEIEGLIARELSEDHAGALHPLMPNFLSPKFSPLIAAEIERVAAKQPIRAIDTSRYEALEAPASTDPTSNETNPQLLDSWRTVLQKAYTSSTHLSTRLHNLALLEQFGKNAWLIGNSQLEEILKKVDTELVEIRAMAEKVNLERQTVQEGVRGEMAGLDDGWRKGIGRLVEVQIAAEQVRREILEKRRAGVA
ncbi:hypothetical protein MMC19_004210 [Ptychographa xylographoides]|nr:hypothetical protein [Ptychographa xylographoides]